MMNVSDMLAFLRTFAALHANANRMILPCHARTMASLLSSCAQEAASMEGKLHCAADLNASTGDNVIHVNFTHAASPPDGGNAA
jgi:hypothetical protein